MKKNLGIKIGSLAMAAAVTAATVPMSMNAYADAAEQILSEQKHTHSADCYCKGGGASLQ